MYIINTKTQTWHMFICISKFSIILYVIECVLLFKHITFYTIIFFWTFCDINCNFPYEIELIVEKRRNPTCYNIKQLPSCQRTIDSTKNSYKCAKCDVPIHNKCMNLSRTEDILMKDSNKKNIFFCFGCDGKTGSDMGELRKSLDEYARSLE